MHLSMSSPSSPVRAKVGTGWGLDTRKCECPTHWGLSLLESPIKAPPGGSKEEAKVIEEEAKKKLKRKCPTLARTGLTLIGALLFLGRGCKGSDLAQTACVCLYSGTIYQIA